MKPIADELAELRAMDVEALSDRYVALYGRAPRVRHKEFLWKRCAWKVQEQRFGGLSTAAQRRLEELMREIDIPNLRHVTGRLRKDLPEFKLGQRIVREWRDIKIVVTVVEGGFEYDGKVYDSITAVADAATGGHRNGRKFFGLPPRKGS